MIKKQDKEMIIKLRANPSTGFSWSYKVSDSQKLAVNEIDYQSETPGKNGSPGYSYFSLRPLQAGAVDLHFTYDRPWLQQPGYYELFYQLVIDETLKIKVTSVKGNYWQSQLPHPKTIRTGALCRKSL